MKNTKLAIVGFSPSSREEAPYDNPEYDIWTMNRAWAQPWMKRWDALFELHPLTYIRSSTTYNSEREHYDWLIQSHGKPIYMQEKYPEVPDSVRYPIERMRKKYGDFYTSSVAFLLALGIDKGYKSIGVWGVDMSAETEYGYQRDSMEYFLGWIMGKGIDLYIPPQCPLLKGRIYAFGDNGIGYRQRLEFRRGMLGRQMDTAAGEYHRLYGYTETLENEIVPKYPDAQQLLSPAEGKLVLARDTVQLIHGAQLEVDEMLKYFDEYYNASGGVKFNGKEEPSKVGIGTTGSPPEAS